MFLFVAFALIGLLWWYAHRVSQELQELRGIVREHGSRLSEVDGQIKMLQRSATIVSTPPVQPRPAKEPASAPAGEPALGKEEPVPPSLPPPLPRTPISEPAFPEIKPARMPEPEPVPEPFVAMPSGIERIKTSSEWEELIGGNLLNKLGALLLVIGIALFLSYSFAHMGPVGIASTATALSAATLAGGTILERRERYRVFSRGLIAAGWAGLYITAYAMYTLPAARIIESPVAGMSLMVLVAAGMVAHSLRYRVQSLTSLAFGCVFAALALSDENTFVAIALIPLAASMLLLARRFQWYGMGLFGAAATYAIFLMRPSNNVPLWKIQAMLLIFWVMFEVFDLLRVNAGVEEWPAPGALFGLNALAGLGASAAVWYRLEPDSMWQFCCAAAALYLAGTWIRFAMPGRTLYEFSLTISAFLAALAIFAEVPGLWISLGVMAEAEVLFLAGRYLNLRFARVLSAIGFAAAAMQIGSRIGAPSAFIWGASIDTWAPPLAVMALVFYFNRSLSKESRYFGFLASALLAIVMGAELPWRYAGAAALVYGVLLMELGIRRDLFDFRLQGYGLTALGAIGAALSFLDPLHVRNAWVYGFGASLSLTLAIRATRYLRSLSDLERRGLRIGGAIGTAGLTAALATRLTPDSYWGIAIVGVSMALFELACAALPSEMLIPALTVNAAGTMRLLVEHAGGVRKYPEQSVWIAFVGAALAYYFLSARLLRDTNPDRTLIRIMAPWVGSAFAIVAIWMLLPTVYVCLAFGAVAILMTEAGLAAGEQNLICHGRAVSLVAAASLAGLASQPSEVIVANGVGIAAMQLILLFRSRSLPFASGHGYLASLIVAGTLFNQVSGEMLTLSWSLEGIGLLALGFAARERTLRLSGLALLLLCIGKVFFYDLRNLETLYRILSFIGLGAILLLVSLIYTRFKEQLRQYIR
ncbi:MAG TPA: DUF2339 domain-containing protein [Bryobacteraceae bacterium]